MIHVHKRYLLNWMVCFLVLGLSAQDKQDTLKVLFVGNSYTYFWNLPQTVEAMSEAAGGRYIMARQSTAGGTTWKQHWDGEKNLKSKALIAEGDWDYVVLQNHSKSTIDNLAQFEEYGQKFIELVRSNGAEPILYMTWAREFNPLMQDVIADGYKKLSEKHQVQLVPVGEIWSKVRQVRPDVKLFDPDGSHPSIVGVYLNAATFFSFFTGENAAVLPHRIVTRDANDQPLYLSIMSRETTEFIQTSVDSFLSKQIK